MIGQKPWAIRTVKIIEDSTTHTLLWYAEGSPFCITEGYLNNPQFEIQRWNISKSGQWDMIESQWKRNDVLIYKNLDNFYSVQLFWRALDGVFLGYYVNFELPYQRVNSGYDTLDLDLDITVGTDMNMQMKDEHEYHCAVLSGDIKPEWATEIHKAKENIIALIDKREFPFDGSLIRTGEKKLGSKK
jgi:predicted RNA-binding protein associated with RNAse of E/G family